MASISGSRRTTRAVGLGSRSCKAAASALPTSRSDSKSDELGALEKGIPVPSHANAPNHINAPSHASASALLKSILAIKYSKANLMRILKIFLKTKSQERKAEVPHKRSLKAKVPGVNFGKLHKDWYHICQQSEYHFKTAGATGLNRTPFVISFLRKKINFRWYQHMKQLGKVFVPWEEFKAFLRKNLGDSRSFVDTI